MASKPHRDKGSGGLHKRSSDGMWIASITLPPGIDGKRRRKTIARKSRGEAQAELRKMRQDLDATGDLSTKSLRVADWMTRYLEEIAPKKDRPTTLSGKRSANDRYITPLLGKKRLDRLAPDDVRALHKAVLSTPKDPKLRNLDPEDLPAGTVMLSQSSAATVHNTLAAALKVAMREGKVRANVCDLVDRPKAVRSQDNSLTTEQSRKLVKHIVENPDQLSPLWLMYLLTGARRGELLGLEIPRVTDTIDLSWQLQGLTASEVENLRGDFQIRHVAGACYLTRPKTSGSWRTPPNVDPLSTVLARAINGRTDGLVFVRADGTHIHPSSATHEWKDLLKAAGLGEDVTLHGTRHAAVDLLYDMGVPEHVVMQIVGHTSRAMTRSYRTRMDLDSAGTALQGLGRQLGIG